MDSSGNLASPKEHGDANGVSSRKRPLHICAVSFIEIAHKIYTKARNLNEPIGIMLERIAMLATLASPVVWLAQCMFLAALSFVDDCILACEDIVGYLFPRTNYVFDKIEELVQITESLPGKLDVVMNKFPTKVHLVPFLDWALVNFIVWLNFLAYNLFAWDSDNNREKGIVFFTYHDGNDQDVAVLGREKVQNKNKQGMAGFTVQPEEFYEKNVTVQPESENPFYREDGIAGLTIQQVITNQTREKDVIIGLTVQPEEFYEKNVKVQPESENPFPGEDGIPGLTVEPEEFYEKNAMVQPGSENPFLGEDGIPGLTIQPVITNQTRQEDVILDLMVITAITDDIVDPLPEEEQMAHSDSNNESYEEHGVVEPEGRAGLRIEPIIPNQSNDEENTSCFTNGTDEEYPIVGLTVKSASTGSNIVGLTIQPICRKGSYKEVLERGRKESPTRNVAKNMKNYNGVAKVGIERRWAMNARNGKKKRSNFRRSASYT